jgi:hypothetical protein
MKKIYFILLISILMCSCSDGQNGNFFQSHNQPGPCVGKNIGDALGGGKIAYFYQSGDPGYISGECHGIIAYSSDYYTAVVWWFYQVGDPSTNATSPTLGDGYTNTVTIFNTYGHGGVYAANIAYALWNYGGSGIYDWAIPTTYELTRLEQNQTSIGGFDNTVVYWSSTERSVSTAYCVSFIDGTTSYSDKIFNHKIRLIRYF